ncbi:MAG: hypothetical protein KDA48_08765, partial [Amphiplicatus sp.]|nr:hypothetical protein [Amphiplicatus sp.]
DGVHKAREARLVFEELTARAFFRLRRDFLRLIVRFLKMFLLAQIAIMLVALRTIYVMALAAAHLTRRTWRDARMGERFERRLRLAFSSEKICCQRSEHRSRARAGRSRG